MRCEEPHAQGERLLCARLVLDVREGGRFHLVVEIDQPASPGACFSYSRPGLFRLRDAVDAPAMDEVLIVFVGLPGQLPVEPVQRRRADQVHLAVKRSRVALRPEEVGPRDGVAPERRCVVPSAGVADELAGHEGDAGRDAQRGVAVGVVEGDSLRCQALHVGRLDQRVAVDAREHASVFVGHDHQDVWPVGLRPVRHCPSPPVSGGPLPPVQAPLDVGFALSFRGAAARCVYPDACRDRVDR